MNICRTAPEIRAHLVAARPGRSVALVPTMGALHDGHVACFRAARRACEYVVASIFVNPSQFNDPLDFAAYPRDEERDRRIAAAAGVDTLFVPQVDEMYLAGHATTVEVRGAAVGFEGDHRPGHFAGVATICVKLFAIVEPQIAVFGQKDAQQVAVIKQVVRDLNLPLAVRVAPTVRAPDGLALSSRNARLSPAERTLALAIPRALSEGLAAHAAGADAAAAARARLDGLDVDYCAVATLDGHPTLVIAARAGRTRLIDNVPLDAPALAGLPHDMPVMEGSVP
jgi:pantoate--beta-alanine ligase